MFCPRKPNPCNDHSCKTRPNISICKTYFVHPSVFSLTSSTKYLNNLLTWSLADAIHHLFKEILKQRQRYENEPPYVSQNSVNLHRAQLEMAALTLRRFPPVKLTSLSRGQHKCVDCLNATDSASLQEDRQCWGEPKRLNLMYNPTSPVTTALQV